MSDHIPDTGKMVTEEWVDAALGAYSDNEWRTSFAAMRAALAAVAPLIAARERERCAVLLETIANRIEPPTAKRVTQVDRHTAGVLRDKAAAIRALGDEG